MHQLANFSGSSCLWKAVQAIKHKIFPLHNGKICVAPWFSIDTFQYWWEELQFFEFLKTLLLDLTMKEQPSDPSENIQTKVRKKLIDSNV